MIKQALVGAAVALVVAGCSPDRHSSGGGATTTTPNVQAVRGWVELTKAPMQDLGIAMGKATFAINSHDYAALRAACHDGHEAASSLQGHMPSPDKELTVALQASLDDFDAASHFCVAAIEDTDANEARHAGEFMNSAEGHLTTATAIRDRILNGSA
ncbi:hypothetical protein [Mycobacterium avium]|uniref:Uncharacterized protein n=2 Tax=Mycobacterium TaxID=1763 RepID=D5PFM1_9MYCO|nr:MULTISPECIES: hypothetical protein [Mycobacterium]EFG75128.1 hypothetical protein HMPREF0591_4965 [Mycobacterium parascrofulaceum ATCC BAA-614]APT10027.1 hypothetical protein BS641_06910 [Mycobacterium avium subsp. hominissuis]AXO24509.1 hypothetical protein DFS55_19485 [Mycobacterium avium subsp. hominissuis]ETZ55797.1 hypothetical protein L839_0435 [Mycobacterium avium MAV_120809_2495]MCA2336276.1 hypothetical protein [Mycobacterium avium]